MLPLSFNFSLPAFSKNKQVCNPRNLHHSIIQRNTDLLVAWNTLTTASPSGNVDLDSSIDCIAASCAVGVLQWWGKYQCKNVYSREFTWPNHRWPHTKLHNSWKRFHWREHVAWRQHMECTFCWTSLCDSSLYHWPGKWTIPCVFHASSTWNI